MSANLPKPPGVGLPPGQADERGAAHPENGFLRVRNAGKRAAPEEAGVRWT